MVGVTDFFPVGAAGFVQRPDWLAQAGSRACYRPGRRAVRDTGAGPRVGGGGPLPPCTNGKAGLGCILSSPQQL